MRPALSLSLCAALALAACTKTDDPTQAAYWIDRLDTRAQRVEALKELGKIGDKSAVPAIVKWLHEEGDWQPDAAYALGQLGDKSAVPELLKAISDNPGSGQDTRSRNKNRTNLNILRALGMLGATEAGDAVLKLLNKGDERVKEAALTTLGQLGDSKHTQVVAEIARNEQSPLVRVAAIRALGELGDGKGAPALIYNLFAELPGVSFYYEARLALVQMGAPAVPLLRTTLERINKDVEALRIDGAPLPEGVIEAKTASVLGALRAKEAEADILQALNQTYKRFSALKSQPARADVLAALVSELAYALGNLGGGSAQETLATIAKDPRAAVSVAASEALTQLGARTAAADLLGVARSGEAPRRRAALLAATRLGGPGLLDGVDALSQDAELGPVAKAGKARLEAAKACGVDAACWKTKLEDDSGEVRDRAAFELGWLGAKDATGALLERANTDHDAEVRMAAVLSLGRLGYNDAKALQDVYERSRTKLEFGPVNDELLRLIAHSKGAQKSAKR